MNRMKPWKLSVFTVFTVIIILFSTYRIFQNFELIFYDMRLQLRPLQDISEDIALIEIDDETLQLLGQWPLPRDFHASLVDVLNEIGVKAVIFDIIFSEATSYDKIFAQSINNAKNVYLPQVFDIGYPLNSEQFIRESNRLLAPITKSLEGGIRQKGHINVLIDPDGKIRKTILFIKEQSNFVAQLGLIAACDFLKLDCANIRFSESKISIDGQLDIPVSRYNELIVNYPGTWKESFEHFSYFKILKGHQEWKNEQGDMGILKRLKNKVCFIGLTATGTVDLRATPFENNYPMLGLQASIFNSIVQNKFIRKISTAGNTIINVLIFFMCLFICIRFSPLVSFVGSALLTALYFAVATGFLIYSGVWVDLFFPLVIIFTTYVGCVSVRWVNEIQQRQFMEKELLIAQDIQKQFLVGFGQDIKNITVVPWFQPAKYVAGDLYDIIRIDDHKTGLLIGDVSGKGLPAALLMAQAISLFRILSKQMNVPNALLESLNLELCDRSAGRFVTALYCVVDPQERKIQASSAGHGSILMYRHKDKKIEELSLPNNVPLGVMKDTVYQTLSFEMRPGDMLILFSDGVTEARDKLGNEFEVEGIKRSVLKSTGNTAEMILESLKKSLLEFSSTNVQHDDITVILCTLNEF